MKRKLLILIINAILLSTYNLIKEKYDTISETGTNVSQTNWVKRNKKL